MLVNSKYVPSLSQLAAGSGRDSEQTYFLTISLSHQYSSNSFTIWIVCGREGESAKASEKRALATLENPNSNEVVATVVMEKPSFLKLNKEGKATTTTTTSYHTENESALWSDVD